MQVRTKLAVLALSLVLLSGGVAVAEEPQANPSKEEMAATEKAATPGGHKHLAKMAGDWTFTNRMWIAPGQPPHEWTGTMRAETVLGGRYVQSVWKGSFMGQEFEGRGTEGYDNASQQYFSSWVDSVGTGIMLATGTCEDGGKKCTTTRSDSMAGGPSIIKTVVSWIDDNNFKSETYAKSSASGEEQKIMEIMVKRK